MRWVLFLSRVAFICNLFFLIAAFLQWTLFIQDETAVSTIVIMGYFLAVFVFNPLVNVIYLILWIKKKLLQVMPKWLVLANFIFLLLQIFFILLLNDTFHY
jgi:hypothetical protein